MNLNFGARLLAVAMIGLLSASPSWARVGVASTVDGQPKGLPPGATERVINIGNDMQPNERVTTGASDKAHIVFLDGSSLTVGPDSVVTIDKFVYDPDRKTGESWLRAISQRAGGVPNNAFARLTFRRQKVIGPG